jgi:tetratricopeptide (TPR) repeat protein
MIDILSQLEDARMALGSGPQSDPLQAVRILTGIVDRDPTNIEALRLLTFEPLRLAGSVGDAAAARQYATAAAAGAERWRQADPEAPEPDFVEAVIAQLQGDLDGAERRFERLCRERPDHVPSMVALMRIALVRKDLDKAVALSTAARRIDPANYEANFHGARAHLLRNEPDEARSLLQEVLPGRNREEAQTLQYFLGQCDHRQGRLEAALAHYQLVTDPRLRADFSIDQLELLCREEAGAGRE